jgi:hypothetical protein
LGPLLSQPPVLRYAMGSQQEVKELERAFNESSWLQNHHLEPPVGHPRCPAAAEVHGICGLSCYTALVKHYKNGAFGCRYEECRMFRVSSLEDAIRHLRYLHFDHRPFVCVPLSGYQWLVYVTLFHPPVNTMLSPKFATNCSYSNQRFHSPIDLANHQQHCP